MKRFLVGFGRCVGMMLIGACGEAPLVQMMPPAEAGPFDSALLAAAGDYGKWGRVDDELRWAPFLCRQPLPGLAHASTSQDASTHGQKLYSVFVKQHDLYPQMSPVGQVVVKESWVAEAVSDATMMWNPGSVKATDPSQDHFYPYAQKDGKLYRASAPAGLFIMLKLDPADPRTDQGWVYGTVSSDGKVTSGGRIAACMGCHEAAQYDRLFGVSRP